MVIIIITQIFGIRNNESKLPSRKCMHERALAANSTCSQQMGLFVSPQCNKHSIIYCPDHIIA